MGGPICNTTLEESHIHEDPILLHLTFHHLGLIICATFALIATVVSGWLIFMHATHYSRPREQKHIIRILFMVPIYSIVSFLSFQFYRHWIYFAVLRDCYEAFAIASFFTLLCHYMAPNLHDQKEHFRTLKPRPWILPVNWFKKCCGGEHGIWRTPRSGLTWFNIIWLGVFQYCLIRILFTVVSVITQAAGRYCEASVNPVFGHIWVLAFNASAVTIAMYCLIQFYIQLKDDFASHRPFLKILCIKLVIFFSFWQTLIISLMTTLKLLRPSNRINYADIKVGFPSLLLCIEMAIFSILHIFAFSHHEYRTSRVSAFYEGPEGSYQGGRFGIKAYRDAYNPWDLIKGVGRGFRWLFVGRRKRLEDSSYKADGGGGGGGVPSSTHANVDLDLGGNQGPRRPPPVSTLSSTKISKPKHYQPIHHEADGEELLTHAQSNNDNHNYNNEEYSTRDEDVMVNPWEMFGDEHRPPTARTGSTTLPPPYTGYEHEAGAGGGGYYNHDNRF